METKTLPRQAILVVNAHSRRGQDNFNQAREKLEAAGVDAVPARLAAMSAVWGRTLQVWRDDEGALNRTMAELDKRLKQMASGLEKVGARI